MTTSTLATVSLGRYPRTVESIVSHVYNTATREVELSVRYVLRDGYFTSMTDSMHEVSPGVWEREVIDLHRVYIVRFDAATHEVTVLPKGV